MLNDNHLIIPKEHKVAECELCQAVLPLKEIRELRVLNEYQYLCEECERRTLDFIGGQDE